MKTEKHRIIYSAFQLPILKLLHEHINHSINAEMVYVLTDTKYKKEFDALYPQAVYHSIFSSRKGLPAEYYNNVTLEGVSDELLDYMAEFKPIALDIMGREAKDAWSFSYNERKWHFLHLLTYWDNVVNDIKPTVFMSRNIPHFASEYILFKVCEFYGIQCLTIENIAPLGLAYITKGIDNRASRISKLAKNFSDDIEVNKQIAEFFDKVRGEREKAIPVYVAEKIKRLKKENSSLYLMTRMFKDLGAILLKGPGKRVFTNIKMNQSPIYDSDSWLTEWKFRLHKWQVRNQISKLEVVYQSFQEKPNLEEKFVFFAPNYQPERTTLPDAGEFGDFLFLIDTISKCLPKGWKIYYKEHPTIFYKPGLIFFRGHLFRSKEYYERLASYDNVKIIDRNIDSFSLIDNSQLVLTATGTVAYEASLRGVPAVMFGQSWASGCNSIFSVTNRAELSEVFNKVQNGYSPCDLEWKKYMNSVEKVSFRKVNLFVEQYIESGGPEMDKEIKRLAGEFVKCFDDIQ